MSGRAHAVEVRHAVAGQQGTRVKVVVEEEVLEEVVVEMVVEEVLMTATAGWLQTARNRSAWI
jgi:hypothetical protein